MRKYYLFVAVVAFFAVFTATALGWHADDVSVEAVCEDNTNTYLVFASIDQSERWPDAYVISITPSSFPGNTSGEQGVTVVIGWDTGETQTFNKTVSLDGSCTSQEEEHKTSLCHATGNSDTFPAKKYLLIPPSEAGAVFGHLGGSHQNGNDIIPPFEYEGTTYSQHWDDEGRDIFDGGCTVPEPPIEECPDGDFNGDEEGCGEPPIIECPNGDLNGDEAGCETIIPPIVPPKGCPDGLPANAGKDGEAGNDDCARTPPVVETIPEVIIPVVTPPVVTPPVIKPPKPKPPVFKPPKPMAPAVCVQLGISTNMVKADGKRDTLVVKVGSREGAKVSIRGAGVSHSARTNAQGIAVFTFNAQRSGIITIKAQGACNNARVGVVDVEAATLSLTG